MESDRTGQASAAWMKSRPCWAFPQNSTCWPSCRSAIPSIRAGAERNNANLSARLLIANNTDGPSSRSRVFAMSLELRRPLAFIDLESTGTSPERDRIVEIAILKLHPDGREESRCKRVNPGVPIPPDATAVHGINDADVAGAPSFANYARGVLAFLEGCDFAGFGVTRFDLPILVSACLRAGNYFSPREMWSVTSRLTRS